ncbi:MAG: hypothetical protein NC115_08830 [Bacteroidales bacterium]|nr:hypothetical protein [Bacteroidales bacterium]
MVIKIKKSIGDNYIDTYQNFFDNKEFRYLFWGHKPINISEWLESNKDVYERYYVYVVKKSHLEQESYVGFFHIRPIPENVKLMVAPDAHVSISGGLNPQLFNIGIGIYSCVAMIDYYFKKNPDKIIYASTFSYNMRSLKMLMGIGFIKLDCTLYDKNHVILTKTDFYNSSITKYTINRVNVFVISE